MYSDVAQYVLSYCMLKLEDPFQPSSHGGEMSLHLLSLPVFKIKLHPCIDLKQGIFNVPDYASCILSTTENPGIAM